ncbi:MAG: hypothetical protein IIB58_06690, partial [Planctomycetes bacterium]|nr:hypothetical protein [Planctomycetota bacterium]
MQQTHWPIRLVILLCIGGAALAGAGCTAGTAPNGNANEQNDDCLADGFFQVAPSRQAVAFIDPPCFRDLLRRSEIEPTVFLQPTVEQIIVLFAEQFPNDADFVLFTLDAHREQLRFNAVGGFNIAINVPEAGLGPFVSVSSFSTLPNLRSYIYLARKDSLVLGPSLHELAHGWGVRLLAPEVLAQQVTDSESHWGFSSAGGQMGGWLPGTLVELGNGRFELSSGEVAPGGRSFNSVPYAPIELYLMGLADPREVDPIRVAINPTPSSLFQFTADEIVELTIDDIITANGQRVPSAEDSQRHFKLTLVVLTDHELNDAEWKFYQDSMDFFAAEAAADINDFFT